MAKYFIILISILFISCGVNQKVISNQKFTKKETKKILDKYENVINLDYASSTFSKLIFNDNEGNWNVLKLSNGKKLKLLNLTKNLILLVIV